jgi:lysozyme
MLQNYDLITNIKKHEGFEQYPYIDPIIAAYPELVGISKEEMDLIKKYFDKLRVTFGIGFTFITLSEADMVLQNRINTIKLELQNRLDYFNTLPKTVQNVLIEMAYQLGVDGLLSFKKTLSYIKKGDYVNAAKEGLNSKWAKQTPERAAELMQILASVKNKD